MVIVSKSSKEYNHYLEATGHAERVDHRSFERQGITDKIPTVHLGVAAHQMEKRGIVTERGKRNMQPLLPRNNSLIINMLRLKMPSAKLKKSLAVCRIFCMRNGVGRN